MVQSKLKKMTNVEIEVSFFKLGRRQKENNWRITLPVNSNKTSKPFLFPTWKYQNLLSYDLILNPEGA
jgi:hypothetical protein